MRRTRPARQLSMRYEVCPRLGNCHMSEKASILAISGPGGSKIANLAMLTAVFNVRDDKEICFLPTLNLLWNCIWGLT